jgi:hypothetical protein
MCRRLGGREEKGRIWGCGGGGHPSWAGGFGRGGPRGQFLGGGCGALRGSEKMTEASEGGK